MMLLTKLLAGLLEQDLTAYADVQCARLTADSRDVQPGTLFLAYKGSCGDGKVYLSQALAKGASAVLIDQQPEIDVKVPYLVVPHLSNILVQLADRFFGFPQQKLTLYAVTGTNGKTSVSYYLAQMLTELGVMSAVIGTTGWGILPNLQASRNTTPGLIELRAMLADLVKRGVQAVVMEVSSHSLVQKRVSGLCFRQAIFTNLTQDHLDYHGSMTNYAAAKFKLFDCNSCMMGIFNISDEYGLKFSQRLKERLPQITYGSEGRLADLTADRVEFLASGIRGYLHHRSCVVDFKAPLLGVFNLENLMAAVAALLGDGYDLSVIAAVINRLQPVKGRMEVVSNREVLAKLVVVDYAHTPDALAKALVSLRKYCGTKGRLWVIFGCGGDRDSDKRAKMGKLATELADRVIVTSDNPRSEDPMKIIDQICAGIDLMDLSDKVVIESNRADAIARALREAQKDDIVLIAGKGHEQYQLINNDSFYFSDQQQVLDYARTS